MPQMIVYDHILVWRLDQCRRYILGAAPVGPSLCLVRIPVRLRAHGNEAGRPIIVQLPDVPRSRRGGIRPTLHGFRISFRDFVHEKTDFRICVSPANDFRPL